MTRRDFSKIGFAVLISALAANVASFIPGWLFPAGLPGALNTYGPLIAFYVVLAPVAFLAFKLLAPAKTELAAITAPAPEEKPKLKMSFMLIIGLFCFCMACSYICNLLGIGLTWGLSTVIFGKAASVLNPVTNLMGENYLLAFLVAAVLAPIVEEFVFRKLLLDALRPAGELTAILFCGIAFGMYHMNFTQFFYAAMLGMVFSYITLKTGTILWSSILHVMINTLGTVVMSYLSSKLDVGNPASPQTLIASLAILAIVGVLFVGGIIFFAIIMSGKKIKIEKSAETEPDKKPTFSKAFFNAGVLIYTAACLVMFAIMLAA